MRSAYEQPPDDRRQKRRCQCCGLPYIYRADTPRSCADCARHLPELGAPETLEHEALRRREDAARVLDFAQRAYETAATAHERRKEASSATGYVAEDRDRWRSLAVALASEHLERLGGACTCGERLHARCPTVRAGHEAQGRLIQEAWRLTPR